MSVFSAMRVAATTRTKRINLAPVDSRGGWWPIIRETFTGAWQANTEVVLTDVLTYASVYACITLIAQDIGKLRIKLVEQDKSGIWTETESASFSPVLTKPNRYQTRIRFLENWITSKLIWGNTYILKQRDNRQVVKALYILDPQRVTVLVAPDGQVYYQVKRDDLSSQPQEEILVPASEIIHDVNVGFYHPLVGVSPISACGLAAMQGLRIQDNSSVFFENGAQPGGFLSAPGAIPQTTADRLKAYFDTNFSGANRGKVAVGGDGLKYEPLGLINAVDSQLIEQLRWTAENVAMAFHMPPYKLGIGETPPYGNYQAVKQDYHETCLQPHMESIELLLDEGLGLTQADRKLGTELDLDNLLRMDTAALITAERDALVAGIKSVNEARFRLGLGPVKGGELVRMQQQVFSLESLAERDEAKPFAKPPSAPAATPAAPNNPAPEAPPDESEKAVRMIAAGPSGWSREQAKGALIAKTMERLRRAA
jgi:HK97 family phage portal protein